ncbi:MAG TPA: hypothetical protein V6C72_03285, partial [Chroococcales cyanobacterium]
MLSRRTFLLGNLAAFVALSDGLQPQKAWSRLGKGKAAPLLNGPHPLARQEWPPAIVPDHIGITDKGYCCFIDDVGRFAIVDMRRPGGAKTPPKVVAELNGLGKKVIDFVVTPGRAIVLVSKEIAKDEMQYVVLFVSLTPITSPSVIGELKLPNYADPVSISVSQDILCVGGVSTSGENLVSIFGGALHKGRSSEMPSLARFSAEQQIAALNLQDRNLAILQTGQPSKLDYVRLADPRNPEPLNALKLPGEFKNMVRFKDTAIVLGTGTAVAAGKEASARSGIVAQSITLEPQPHLVSSSELTPVNTILDASMDASRLLVLGDGPSERLLVSMTYDRNKNLHQNQTLTLPHPKGSYGQHSTVLLAGKSAYIASGWAGVQILSAQKNLWEHSFDYNIPRLPASSLASWGDLVVLAGADLKLYDIAQPSRPELVTSTDMLSSVKKIVGAGSFVLCLSKDSLSLRKMDQLSNVVATVTVQGTQLAFDRVDQKAYMVKPEEKTTTVTRFSIYSNSIAPDKPFTVDGSHSLAYANAGYLVVAGLHDVALYGVGAKQAKPELIGSRHLENLAVRDIYLTDDNILVSAVDQNSKGFFLILSKDQNDLRVAGS